MNETTQKTLKSASQALALLTKVRCVESYSFSPETRFKMLYAWPSQFESDSEVIGFLQEKNINLYDKLKVKSYPVSYKSYKRHKEIKVPEILDVRLARSLLGVYDLISNENENTKIIAIWDRTKYPGRSYPKSTSQIEELEAFSQYRDSMLAFRSSDNNFYLKLPAFTFRSLFVESNKFTNHAIEPEDRNESVGESTDHEGRSKRYIVHAGNKNYLTSVLTETSQSVEKLVGSSTWAETLKEDAAKFYKE
jgi:hypothetical protein